MRMARTIAYRLSFAGLLPIGRGEGHGPGQEVLQTGKREVAIVNLEPVGHYALKPTFSDGHDSGLYSWEYLHDLCEHQDELWNDYLQRLESAGANRDVPMVSPAKGCGH